ncbi:hypothetical protein [Streptomyces sp. NPDC088789]|uniref:hypothetical protein n=1 Tax=Streptomyces sp. NPDC088789 TaxID=3365899 RepID=UPI00380C3EA4
MQRRSKPVAFAPDGALSVSSTVRALERELRAPLFDRTPVGEALVPAARATLRAAELAREAVDAVRGSCAGG